MIEFTEQDLASAWMIHDPRYEATEHLRTEALVEAVLQATTPVALP
jgi:hypothetical protein